ncbi:hypothetical protein RND71_010982 [Anisodus tanguticus]|uniref:Uncharacterized protein n=1 Tax=Anisodus tanguticus TaxID=243964 RepID=A0AAE1SLC9_9SOLA|nr:hypothetical protein RND71_010982 [Anisodus tanguticus]
MAIEGIEKNCAWVARHLWVIAAATSRGLLCNRQAKLELEEEKEWLIEGLQRLLDQRRPRLLRHRKQLQLARRQVKKERRISNSNQNLAVHLIVRYSVCLLFSWKSFKYAEAERQAKTRVTLLAICDVALDSDVKIRDYKNVMKARLAGYLNWKDNMIVPHVGGNDSDDDDLTYIRNPRDSFT